MKYLLIAILALALLLGSTGIARAATLLFPTGGGTGWGNIQSGSLLYGNGTGKLATTTQGTGGQVLAWLNGIPSWTATSSIQNISLTTTGSSGAATLVGNTLNIPQYTSGGASNVSTSSAETSTYVPFWTSTAGTPALLSGGESTFVYDSSLNKLTVENASTTNFAVTGTATTTFAGAIDLTSLTSHITAHGLRSDASDGIQFHANNWTDIAVFGAGNTANSLFYGGVNIDGATRLATSLNGLLKASSGAISAASAGTDYVAPATTLTVAGTANQITSSAGAQDLSANRTWTLSFPSHIIFPSSYQAALGTTTNATSTTSHYFPFLTSKLLRTDSAGKLADVTVGTGLSFDGTTLSNSGLASYDAWTHPSATSIATTTASLSLPNSGFIGFAGNVAIDTTNYSLFGNTTLTLLNARSGGSIGFRIANADVANFTTTGGFGFGSTYYNIDPGQNNMTVEGRLGVGSSTPGTTLSIGTGADYINLRGTATSTFSKAIYSPCFSTNGTTCMTAGAGISAIGPAGQTQTGATITMATTSDTNIGLTITGSGDTLTYTSNWIGTLANSRLTNSTISGIALGASLGDLTATDSTLTFSGTYNGGTARTIGLNLTNANVWTGHQRFTNASSTLFSNVGTAYFGGTATTTINSAGSVALPTGATLTVTDLTSAILLTNGSGVLAEYAGTSCTNQFVRSLSALGAATCATVANTDLANSTISGVALGGTLGALSATNSTLTFSGSYTGAAAQTVGLNLGNANTWTAAQTFNIGSGAPGILSNSLVGIGTTTPKWALQVASSTGPQVALSDASITSAHWTLRSISGSLYVATASPSTFATSSVASFSIDTNNIVTFTNKIVAAVADFTAGILRAPYSASPTIATNGDIGIDSTSNQFKYFSGSAVKVLGNGSLYPSFTYSTTTAWAGTTTIPLGPTRVGETWNDVTCFTDAGTLGVSFYDGTTRMTPYIPTASTTVNVNLLTTNNTFTSLEKRYVDVGTPASSPTKISCTVNKSLTAD